MNKRLAAAMAVYGILFLIAFAVLNGLVLKATSIALALFAIKTVIAHKAQG
jgi:hypothetical protein